MKDVDNKTSKEEFIEAFRPSGQMADIWYDREVGLDVYDWFRIQLHELKTAATRALVKYTRIHRLEQASMILDLDFCDRVGLLVEVMTSYRPERRYRKGRYGIAEVMEEWSAKANQAFIWRAQLEAGEYSALQQLRSRKAQPEEKAKAAGFILDFADYTSSLRLALEEEILAGR